MEQSEAVSFFYLKHLQNIHEEKTHFIADCPFCKKQGREHAARLVVYLNRPSFFYGYFRCLNRCVPSGFTLWFARLMGVCLDDVPGYDPDRESFMARIDYPIANINNEIKLYQDRMSEEILAW
ncbi:MAG: DNA helicase, partial [Desulfocapsaceae bacterium]|nr:DNA helicase [Desulfocapsaceae bacterium]